MSSDLQTYLASLPQLATPVQARHLYAAFPSSRENGPASWDAKLNFWSTTLKHAMQHALLAPPSSRLSLDAQSLPGQFQLNGAVPLGLSRVLAELVRSGQLIKEQDLQRRLQGGNWIVDNLIKAPALWLLSSANLYNAKGPDSIASGQYVHIGLLEQVIETAKTRCHSRTECVMDMPEFCAQMLPAGYGEQDAKYVLVNLASRGALAQQGEVIKMSTDGQPPAISSVDQDVLKLKSTLRKLQHQVDDLTAKIQSLTETARQHVRQQLRSQAAACIKRRKLLQAILDKRTGALDTLSSILLRIESSESDAEVLEAYAVGTSALQNVIKTNGLTVERADETIDALTDALTDHQEIDRAFSTGFEQIQASAGVDLDDTELEGELDALIAAEQPAPRPNHASETVQQLEHLPIASHPLPRPTKEGNEATAVATPVLEN
ncbi:hypothetical protein RI367_006010 [Sorochytrium milnesiophthora]